jgi:hypothetical protein
MPRIKPGHFADRTGLQDIISQLPTVIAPSAPTCKHVIGLFAIWNSAAKERLKVSDTLTDTSLKNLSKHLFRKVFPESEQSHSFSYPHSKGNQ